MDNEDFQKLVLDQLAKINKRLDFFEHRMESVHGQPDIFQECLTRIETQTQKITGIFAPLQRRLETLITKLDKLPKATTSKEPSPIPICKEEISDIREAQQLHDEWLRVLSADTAQLKAGLHRLRPLK